MHSSSQSGYKEGRIHTKIIGDQSQMLPAACDAVEVISMG